MKQKTSKSRAIDFHLCLSTFFFHLAPSKPLNLLFTLQKPSEIAMPRMTVQWQPPAEQNGMIRKYSLLFTYTIDGRQTTITSEANNQTFSHSLDVFGGIQYSVEIWAETIKPGQTLNGAKQVPPYSKYLLFKSLLLSFWAPMCRWFVNVMRKKKLLWLLMWWQGQRNFKMWFWAASPSN